MKNTTPTREEILSANPLVDYLKSIGVEMRGGGDKLTSRTCPRKTHGTGHFPCTIDVAKQLFHCNDCPDTGGTVIDWMAIAENRSPGDVYKELAAKTGNGNRPKARSTKPLQLVKVYDYTDENGKIVFQVCRYEPKDFKQRHRNEAGQTIYNMDGVGRVLYNLPAVLDADEVCVVEGEKDADSLTAIGLTATCNVGGAKKWLDPYTEVLTGKDVILMPDNDKDGLEHRDLVLQSITGKVKTIRVLLMPKPHKDVSDFLASAPDAKDKLFEIIASAKVWRPGADVPLKDMGEMQDEYRKFVKDYEGHTLSCKDCLPGLSLRPIVPGEMVLFVGDVAVGKTIFAQNIILSAPHLPAVMFEMELPTTMMFERFLAMATGISPDKIENTYRDGASVDWSDRPELKHFQICDLSGITVDDIQSIIQRAELRMGVKPVLVVIDYVGLVKSHAAKRYERVSEVAESLKVIAKTTNTIMVVLSQRSRPAIGEAEVGLHDARDSGSLEASAQLVLGGWRDPVDNYKLNVAVLKSNKGGSGEQTSLWLNPDSLRLETEAVHKQYMERKCLQNEP